MIRSLVSIGDSFTEGLGDYYPDGSPRGWADRLAEGLAAALAKAEPEAEFRYANLAIRGRKLAPLLDEQLDQAIALKPDLVSLNGGGNDMLRPNFGATNADTLIHAAVNRLRAANIRVLLLSGPDPSKHLPGGKVFRMRGEQVTNLTMGWATTTHGVYVSNNFDNEALRENAYWSEDGLHLNTAGHLQVAMSCLDALGVPHPSSWQAEMVAGMTDHSYASKEYYQEFIVPWIGRRLTGRSCGDGRTAKRPSLEPVGLA